MAYISSFIYCDSIQTEITPQGPAAQIVRPLQALIPIALPSNYSFAIACNIMEFDVSKENSLRICFISPSGNIIHDTGEIKFNTNKDEQMQRMKKGLSAIQFNLDIRNLVLREEGVHTTKVYINNNKIGEYKIAVIKAGD